jgi:hypothetical protein
MKTIRWLVASGALLGLAAFTLHAQAQPASPGDTAAAAPKAPSTKKTEATRNAPAKDAKKESAKADDRKKAAAKKAAPKKGEAGAKKPATYSKSMEIRDEKGNIIPINPDAYDVSSALPGKSAPKK